MASRRKRARPVNKLRHQVIEEEDSEDGEEARIRKSVGDVLGDNTRTQTNTGSQINTVVPVSFPWT